MAQGLGNFIAILESWGLMDVIIPFFILLITLFFLVWALLNFTKLKTIINILISAVIGMVGSWFFVMGHITHLISIESDVVYMINMFLPQIILFPLLYLIALFPLLILIKNKRYFYITLLLFYLIMLLFIDKSGILILLLPLSLILLVYNKRNQIISSNSIKIVSIIISSIGLVFIVSLSLMRNTNLYFFLSNWFGTFHLYFSLIVGLILWLVQIVILFKKKELIL